MNFPFPFGQPPLVNPFFPQQNSMMPWNFSSMTNPFPVPPSFPMPGLPMFPPQRNTNLMINQHQNHFYGPTPSIFPLSGCPNPYFEKIAQVPKPSLTEASTIISKKRQKKSAKNNKDIEVIEISDGEDTRQKKNDRMKRRLISKEKRLLMELNKLSNKKYGKLLEENSQNIEKELKQIVQTIESQPKRKTRGANERIPKIDKYLQDNWDIKSHQQKRKTKCERQQNLHKEESNLEEKEPNLFENFEIQTILPKLKSIEQFLSEKAALKESLILRHFKNL